MSASSKSIRIHIDFNKHDSTPIISYKELVKREREATSAAPVPMALDLASEDDKFYKGLLERAAKYELQSEDVQQSDDDESNIDKKRILDEYDYEDPFIDDSDMLLDNPYEHDAQKEDGFFAYMGPLDGGSSKRKTTAKSKPKSTKKEKPSKASTSKPDTTDSPDLENTPETSTKSSATKASTTKPKKSAPAKEQSSKAPLKKQASDQGEKKKTSKPKKESTGSTSSTPTKKKATTPSDLLSLHPQLEAKMEKIRHDASQETIVDKSKFPPKLRPTVLEAGTIMFRLENKVDENLINHLMAVIPYNGHTLRKFLTTKVGGARAKELEEEVEALNKKLKDMVDKAMPEHQRQQDEKIATAQSQQQEKQIQASTEESPASTAPSSSTETEDDPAMAPKFKCNDDIRNIIYDMVQKDGARISLSNSIATYTSKPTTSEDKAQKLLYQKMVSHWPEGWMTTAKLRRQYTLYKTKVEKGKLTTTASQDPPPKRAPTKKPEKNVSGPEDEQKAKRKRPAQLTLPQTVGSAPKKQTISGRSLSVEPSPSIHSQTTSITSISAQPSPTSHAQSPQQLQSPTTSSTYAKSPSMKIDSLITHPPA